jgi:hypothetical protein
MRVSVRDGNSAKRDFMHPEYYKRAPKIILNSIFLLKWILTRKVIRLNWQIRTAMNRMVPRA